MSKEIYLSYFIRSIGPVFNNNNNNNNNTNTTTTTTNNNNNKNVYLINRPYFEEPSQGDVQIICNIIPPQIIYL